MVRIRSTAETFRIAAQATIEEAKRALVQTARREHARVLGDGGRPIPFTRYVDGQKGLTEDAVNPFGVIQYDYHRLEEVVEYAMQVLFDFSPVLKDEYRRAHTLVVNMREEPNLKNWKPGDEVVITNPVPYTRKIEQGRMKMRVPGTDHVYERAAIAVNRRFGNIAKTQFTYRSGILPYIPGGATRDARAALRGNPARLAAMSMERNTRVPALAFTEYV